LEEAINIKLVVLGEGGVGKTSLVNTFLGEELPSEYLPTIGNNVHHKDYILDNVRVRVNIWDCGGQKAYNIFNPAVYNNVDAAFLVFDLSKPEETVKNLKNEHIENLENYAEEEDEAIRFIVGNKLDLVLINKHLEPLKSYLSEDDLIVATSAKTGENVDESFDLLIYTFLKQTKRDKLAKEFLKTTGKTEKQLVNQLIDLESIDILLLKEKVKPKSVGKDTISIESEESEFIQYHDIKRDLEKTELVRNSIFDKFYSTLTEIEEGIKTIKKSSQKTIGALIDDLGYQLILIGNDIESDLNYLSDLEKDENIVIDSFVEIAEIEVEEAKPKREVIEINKIEMIEQKIKKELPKEPKIEKKIVKEIKVAEPPMEVLKAPKFEKKIVKEIEVAEPPGEVIVEKDLYQMYESLNPGKKAIMQGIETKEFLAWMKNYLGIEAPKKEKVKAPAPEQLPEEDLHKIYERDNPGKKAIWRGKETKGFLTFKERFIDTKKEKLGAEIAKSDMIEVKSEEDLDAISAKIKADLIIEDKEENLHSIYEEENPGKKAIWRGKTTKGFLDWKENYLSKGNK
jgi:small GTP-binding protein